MRRAKKNETEELKHKGWLEILCQVFQIEKSNPIESEEDGWWKAESIESICKILSGMFEICNYQNEAHCFNVKPKEDSVPLTGYIPSYDIQLTKKDRDDFIRLFSLLHDDISSNKYCHFILDGVTEITKYKRNPYIIENEYTYIPSYQGNKERKISSATYDNLKKAAEQGKSKPKYCYDDMSDIPMLNTIYTIYDVIHITELGEAILYINQSNELVNHVYDINYPTFDSILQIIKSLLVSYHISNKGFSGLGVCAICDKLFIRNKSGIDVVCGATCRLLYKRQIDKIDTQRNECIKIQNQYLKSKYYPKKYHYETSERPYFMRQSDCKRCVVGVNRSSMAGGECPVLILKNNKFMEIYEEYNKTTKRDTV